MLLTASDNLPIYLLIQLTQVDIGCNIVLHDKSIRRYFVSYPLMHSNYAFIFTYHFYPTLVDHFAKHHVLMPHDIWKEHHAIQLLNIGL